MTQYRIIYEEGGYLDAIVLEASQPEYAEEKFWDIIEEWRNNTYGIEIVSIEIV